MSELDNPTGFYHAELRPHRSLPPRGFTVVMLILAGVSFAVSLGFVLRGAWPVTPFFGVDVALVYVAFRLSYRSARQREHLRLTQDEFTLERIDVYGARKRWRFQPFWLRVILDERGKDVRFALASHGREITVGSFLGPEQRKEAALSLKNALAKWRSLVASPRS